MTGLLLLVLAQTVAPAGPILLDDFGRPDAWSAHPADGVQLILAGDRGKTGRALRLDFSFGGGGYAIARRTTAVDLPPKYAFSFWIKGEAKPNTLEFKLLDRTGENVWWYTEPDRVFDGEWHKITVRKRQIRFAWGPLGGGDLKHVAAIELVITAGRGGGSGRIWVDDLTLTPMPDLGPYKLTPIVTATSSAPGHPPWALLDADSTTTWRAAGSRASVTIDFRRQREYGGLTLVWDRASAATGYAALISDDGTRWRRVARRPGGPVARDYLYLPDTESRFLRLDLQGGRGNPGLREVRIEPLEWSASRNAFFAAPAGDAVRGTYPRYFSGERADWTVVGVDGAVEEALLSEDGAIEAGTGAFSVEPFVSWLAGAGVAVNRLSTWWGPISYTAQRQGIGVTVSIAAGLRIPPGGLLIHPPGSGPVSRVTVNGVPVAVGVGGAVVIRSVPASISFER